MKTVEQRINNIIGQLQGSKKMLAADKWDCLSILTQLKASKSAISSLMDKIIKEEFDHCLAGPKKTARFKIEQIFKEITKK